MSSLPAPTLSVVIICWNEKQYLIDCLDHLLLSIGDISHEIILVDNNSTDGSKELLRSRYPQVLLVENSENLGIAKARNVGLKHVRGTYVLILDIDTKVAREAIPALVRLLDTHPRVGAVGARLNSPSGSLQHSCRQFPTVTSKLMRVLGATGSAIYLDETYSAWDHNDTRSVGYVIGACQLFRRTALAQIGHYKEYKLYGPDDLEICLRLWLNGWQVVYHPEAVIVHVEQRRTRKKIGKLTLYHFLALVQYFWEYRYAFDRDRLQRRMRSEQLHFPFPPQRSGDTTRPSMIAANDKRR